MHGSTPIGTAVYGYCRVSHEESKKSGLSVAAQKDAITRYCQHKKLAKPRFFVDEAVSAWKVRFFQRPKGKILRNLMKPGDTIIFYRLDRGFRSLLDFVKTVPVWIEEGYNVVILDQNFDLTTANGKLFLNVMAAYAQWKSDMISQRTKAGLERKRLLGSKRPPRTKLQWQSSAFSAAAPQISPDTMSAETGRVFSYGRVSHRDSMEGMSLEAQRTAINDYIGWNLAGIPRGQHFEDHAVSAYHNALVVRPGGKDLNSQLASGDHVVFARLDRVWRSTIDMALTWTDWKARGISVHFADTGLSTANASGEALMELLTVFAKWESADISERTKAALRKAREQGKPTCSVAPMGSKIITSGNKKWLVPDCETIADMWFISHIRNTTGMSFRKISDHMEKVCASRENRQEISEAGIYKSCLARRFGVSGLGQIPKKQLAKLCVSKDKSLYYRQWDYRRCEMAYKNWPKVQQQVRQIKSSC